MIPREIQPQGGLVVDILKSVLGGDLVGVYLHGSAVLGCFGPYSDIDLVAVTRRAVSPERKQALRERLLQVSGTPRPVELDLVPVSALRRWHHPARFEFHYSESLRPRFEAGELEPWDKATNRDLAAHVSVLRQAGVALVGPPPDELFPEVPDEDFRDALLYDVEWWRDHIPELASISGGMRNAVLSLARIWATLAAGVRYSKPRGADWVLPRLPEELRPVLDHARNLYTSAEDEERWLELPVAAYITAVAEEIDALT